MKILLLHDVPADKQNGVSVSLGILYRELKKLGHDIRILTLSENSKSYKENDCYCMASAPAFVYPEMRVNPIFKHKYVKELIAWNPDIIHTNCEFSTFVIARHIAKKCRKRPKWVHTFHTDYRYYIGVLQKISTIRNKLVPWFLNECFTRADALIVPTKKIYDYIREDRFSDNINMKIIPTGIDFSGISACESDPVETRKELGIEQDAKVILFLGRVSQEKNLAELLMNFAAYSKKNDKAYLVVIGKGPYTETLRGLVKANDLEAKVHIHGGVDHSEIRKYYDIADVFSSASLSETQGLTFYEALYCGVPVLAKDRRCLEDAITEGENGAFFDNTQEFIESLDKIINLKSESKGNGRKLPESFESANFAKGVYELYTELLKEKR